MVEIWIRSIIPSTAIPAAVGELHTSLIPAVILSGTVPNASSYISMQSLPRESECDTRFSIAH